MNDIKLITTKNNSATSNINVSTVIRHTEIDWKAEECTSDSDVNDSDDEENYFTAYHSKEKEL